jgi:hypothetical protein
MYQSSFDKPAIEIITGNKTQFTYSSYYQSFFCVDKLYWISASSPPKSHSEAYFFNVDSELVYEPFNSDFGPLNLAMTHKYIRELCRLLADPKYLNIKLFHYTCLD